MSEQVIESPALQDIAGANAAAEKYLGASSVEIPKIGDTANENVELPAGLLMPDGTLVTDAVVRELTGEDEEALSRTIENPARLSEVLLERGIVSIGGQKPTKAVLDNLLTGDRSALILGIRIATYGSDVDTSAYCPNCQEWVDISLELHEDVPMKKLENPEVRQFTVDLRHGGKAEVRLLNGATDDKVTAQAAKLTGAQVDTLVLSQCVGAINGQPVLGTTGPVLRLGIADRKKIIEFLNSKSFGPMYNEIKFTHDICGKEVPVPLGPGDLFQF